MKGDLILQEQEFLIGWLNSARDRKWKVRLGVTAGGRVVRSNGHPSASNTVRCFPGLGFLPFRQEGQLTGCLLMWKYTVYIQYVYVGVCVCVLCAFKLTCTHNCLRLNVCVQMIHMETKSHVLALPLWWTCHSLHHHLTDLLYRSAAGISVIFFSTILTHTKKARHICIMYSIYIQQISRDRGNVSLKEPH